jgi:hypothetical protein
MLLSTDASRGKRVPSMSMELFVIFALSKSPTFDLWQSELEASRSPAQFAQKVDLQQHSGFLPMKVQGRDSGFFFLRESYSDLAAHYPPLRQLKQEDPVVYALGYGGNFDECASAFYSAAALVSMSDGKAFEPQGGVFMSKEELVEAASRCLELAKEQ